MNSKDIKCKQEQGMSEFQNSVEILLHFRPYSEFFPLGNQCSYTVPVSNLVKCQHLNGPESTVSEWIMEEEGIMKQH